MADETLEDMQSRYLSTVDLRDGFPDFPSATFVTALKEIVMSDGILASYEDVGGNGHPKLVDILSQMYSYFYNVQVDPLNEILVTYGDFYSVIFAFRGLVKIGDEVLIIEPASDIYRCQIEVSGGVPVPIVMNLAEGATSASQFTIDFADMESKINEKTKMLVINNPHNPTGKLFSRQELENLADIAKKHNLIVLADEGYEFHVWNKDDMIRFASLPGMYERTISIGSAGKVFSGDGWTLGWVVGPARLLEPLRAYHQDSEQFPCKYIQMAVALALRWEWPLFLNDPQDSYLASGLSEMFRCKRDKMARMLEEANFRPIIPDAGYFMLADYSHLKEVLKIPAKPYQPDDMAFSSWLSREKKLTTGRLSRFYTTLDSQFKHGQMIIFAYFKKFETLHAAEEILKKLGKE